MAKMLGMPPYLSLAALQQKMNWVLQISFCVTILLLFTLILSSFVFMIYIIQLLQSNML